MLQVSSSGHDIVLAPMNNMSYWTVVACPGSVQYQNYQNCSMNEKNVHEAPLITEELSAVGGYWGRIIIFQGREDMATSRFPMLW